MACTGCGNKEIKTADTQKAVSYRAVLSGLEVVEGKSPDDFRKLRDRCFYERRFILAGKLYFNDANSRNFGGWSWVYLIESGDSWTIDDDASSDNVHLKYRDPVLIPGGTVMESEIQAALEVLRGD